MNTILSKEKVDSGSNYNFPDKMEIPRVPKSVFNLSHLVSGTLNNAGLIVPLFWCEYMPQDSFKLSVRHLIRVMPQVVPLLSRQRLFIHAFACDYTDLQSDFEVLMSRGYSGNRTLKIAPLTTDNIDSELVTADSETGEYPVVESGSLADFLGLPQGVTYTDLISSGISCLPFLMYESIYKNYYMNKNYYIENRNWLPDDPETFRVNENGVLASNTDSDHEKVYFGKLHYRDYPMDYFTSALPFAQRGDRPTLSLNLSGGMFNPDSNSIIPQVMGLLKGAEGFSQNTVYADNSANNIHFASNVSIANGDVRFPFLAGVQTVPEGTDANTVQRTMFANTLNSYLTGNVSAGIGLDEFRELARQQVELEKMARTDGSFGDFILTFFSTRPKTRDCRPKYIGGTYSQISFTEVLQTSQSSESSALGQIAGHGISVDNNGFLGTFNADNFGILMVVATIMPDVYYHQGLEKKWTRKYQSEFYLPERAKMGLQPIYNKELYFTGTSADDNDLFGYQNPFDDFRYMQNRICGKLADSSALSFYPYTQARTFTETPTLSQSFAIADEVRKDYLFAPIEDAYLFQFAFDIRAVRPLPYKAVPNNFGF